MKKIMLVMWAFQLSGCAAMMADYQKRTCNYEGAYESGVNDAQSGKALNSERVVGVCEEKTRSEAARGYREGYMTIKKNPVIQINQGSSSMASCRARPGSEAHQGFCTSLNNFTCSAHNICIWQ